MNEELYKNKLMVSSPTSISLGHITWFALDTKLVGRVKALLEERDNLQSKIDKAIEYVSSLSSKGKDCEIYYDIKKEILDILKEDK